jgi:hypothetical protein
MVARKLNKTFPDNWHVGYTTFRAFEWYERFTMQPFLILSSAEKTPERHIKPSEILRSEWIAPSYAPTNKVVLNVDKTYEAYIGRTFQAGNNSHTIESILHDQNETHIYVSPPTFSVEDLRSLHVRLLSDPPDFKSLYLKPYKSQFNLQGYFFAAASEHFGMSVAFANFMLSFIFSGILALIFLYYEKIFPKGFAICFLMGLFLSPSITGFAKNMYWVVFTWFFPALFACQLFCLSKDYSKGPLFLAIFAAFTLKFLCGYEYASSVVCLSIAPFLYAAISSREANTFWFRSKEALCICFLSVGAFTLALCAHATKRGDTIWQGISNIYTEDITRRTYGDPNRADFCDQESLRVSPLTVVYDYIFNINLDFLPRIPWNYFKFTFFIALLSFPLRGRKFLLTAQSDFALLLSFLPIPISWFVLGKGHSWLHKHMNLILWYWGFVGVLFFLCWRTIKILCKRFWLWIKALEVEA